MTRHTFATLRKALRTPSISRLLVNSMGFEGIFHASKDYLQPVLAAIALAHLGASGLEDQVALAIVLTPVYVVLFVLAGISSRMADAFASRAGGERRAMRVLWAVSGVCFAALCVQAPILTSVAFILLHVLQNLWRPMLVSRFDDEGDESSGATLLSIESQARHLVTMIAAPIFGYAIQSISEPGGAVRLWPIGIVGVVASMFALSAPKASRRFRPSTR